MPRKPKCARQGCDRLGEVINARNVHKDGSVHIVRWCRYHKHQKYLKEKAKQGLGMLETSGYSASVGYEKLRHLATRRV